MASSDPNLYAFELTFKALYESKTPVSRSKIQAITDAALKAQKFYKHVVMHIETFIRKSSPKHKLPGIYVIDSIVRLSQRHYGKERDVFAGRFAKNLGVTFTNAAQCADEDKFKVFRCFKLWKESDIFSDEIMTPIVERIEAVESFEKSDNASKMKLGDENGDLQLSHGSPEPQTAAMDIEEESPKRSAEKVRFDKRLLDFDYSDEDEGQSDRVGGKRGRKRDNEDEDEFFVIDKDGKPEFSVDKIMMGLRQSRQNPPSTEATPLAVVTENPKVAEPIFPVDVPVPVASVPKPHRQSKFSEPPPVIPDKNTAVVLKSCTIWIGHLSKAVAESELRKELARHGTIKTIDLIPSRGCAYISYEKRVHAENAMSSSSRRDLWNIFGDKLKMNWSPGKGIKDGYKGWDWDADTGICEIKLSKLPSFVRGLHDGCEVIEDTIPIELKARFRGEEPEEKEAVPVVPSAPSAANAATWQTTASFGFNSTISPWGAQLQMQQFPNQPPPPIAPPLPVISTLPSSFPQFPSSDPQSIPVQFTPLSLSVPQQNGQAAPLVNGQTTWKDPVVPDQRSKPESTSTSLFNSLSSPILPPSLTTLGNPQFFSNLQNVQTLQNMLFPPPPPAFARAPNYPPPRLPISNDLSMNHLQQLNSSLQPFMQHNFTNNMNMNRPQFAQQFNNNNRGRDSSWNNQMPNHRQENISDSRQGPDRRFEQRFDQRPHFEQRFQNQHRGGGGGPRFDRGMQSRGNFRR